ncbi:MAG: YraN family protein [Muribaculaceae bacterium]|nr:YraN family protein [Muribaculaceae bacterium]
MARHTDLGKWGEQLAVDKLTAEGYSIVERNWRLGHIEIDIVAQKNEVLVIAEVKTRSELDVDPLEAIDKAKMARMIRAANAYIKHSNLNYQIQFDLFAINGTPENYRIEHIPDAFYPPLKVYR